METNLTLLSSSQMEEKLSYKYPFKVFDWIFKQADCTITWYMSEIMNK